MGAKLPHNWLYPEYPAIRSKDKLCFVLYLWSQWSVWCLVTGKVSYSLRDILPQQSRTCGKPQPAGWADPSDLKCEMMRQGWADSTHTVGIVNEVKLLITRKISHIFPHNAVGRFSTQTSRPRSQVKTCFKFTKSKTWENNLSSPRWREGTLANICWNAKCI